MASTGAMAWGMGESLWSVTPVAQSYHQRMHEIRAGSTPEEGRIRQPGAGRKLITVNDLQLNQQRYHVSHTKLA